MGRGSRAYKVGTYKSVSELHKAVNPRFLSPDNETLLYIKRLQIKMDETDRMIKLLISSINKKLNRNQIDSS